MRSRILREIREVIGESGVSRLVRRFGGTNLTIPKRVDDTHPLAVELGREAADKFVRYFGGEVLYIPLSRNNERNEEIRRMAGSETVNSLARRYNLSERQIRNILRR